MLVNNRDEFGNSDEANNSLGLSYKVDNGKEFHESVKVSNLYKPEWTDSFPLTIMSEAEIIFFQLMLVDKTLNSSKVLDAFDLRGSEISSELKSSKIFEETLTTRSGNEYFISIK